MSKIVPSDVQTGVENGWRDTAQKLKGSCLKEVSVRLDEERLEPALAEYAASDDHSLWVI